MKNLIKLFIRKRENDPEMKQELQQFRERLSDVDTRLDALEATVEVITRQKGDTEPT